MAKKTKSRSKAISEAPIKYKPSLLIDSKRLRGNTFRVGKKAKVIVSGTITEESIRDYEAPRRKSFKMEIDKVSKVPSRDSRRRRR